MSIFTSDKDTAKLYVQFLDQKNPQFYYSGFWKIVVFTCIVCAIDVYVKCILIELFLFLSYFILF